MRAAIDTFEQDGIDLAAEFLNGIDDAHAEIVAELFGVSLDPAGAGFDIRTAAFEGDDHFRPRHVVRIFGVVQQFGERNDMGGVQADDTYTQVIAPWRAIPK